MKNLCSTIAKVVVILVITDQTVPFRVLQTVRRGDVTSTRVTVWAAYRDIRDISVAKVRFHSWKELNHR